MRILINSINFSPELTGIGKYSGEMAEWLVAAGHEVRVVTAPPYYPQWRVAEGYSNGWSKEDSIQTSSNQLLKRRGGLLAKPRFDRNGGSLLVYRCPLWVPAKPSGLKRVLHLVSFALSSFPLMLWQIFWHPDVVLVVEPPLFCAPQAWLVARLSGGKAWLHIQDFEVDAAFDLELLKGAALRCLVSSCESGLMRRFDRVSTISQRMLERVLTKCVAPERVVLFPNWVELEKIRTEDSKSSEFCLNRYRDELGIAADAVVALYSGNMGGMQGLEILAQVATLQMQRESTLNLGHEVIFVFCGNGAGRADLVALCGGLPNVRFMDLQPSERLRELLAMADIHLLPQRADAADLVMPSKLTGMLASSRPVVVTAHEHTELAIVVACCGLVVKPEDPQAFSDAINTLAQDAVLRTRLGKAGRAFAEANFDKEVLLGRFEVELKAVTSRNALAHNEPRQNS